LLGRAALALDQEAAAAAREWADRFLRRLPADTRTERAAALEILVRADLALGDDAAARTAAAELQIHADATGTAPLQAAALAVEGLIAAAAGDHTAARCHLEDAADLYGRIGAPYESACTRLDLAASLRALGDNHRAERETDMATATLRRIGASRRVLRLFGKDTGGATADDTPSAGPRSSSISLPSPLPHGLTGREVEVLRLLARGLSNQEIAGDLVLSVRTVERHISTIYEKLGARGKVARATASAYAVRQGIS
jgi:ATP/maltotriose-dependent transcriptional regulator MalT